MPVISPYTPELETSWLRCRALSFLDTCYFDDVWTTRPDEPGIQLVATEDGGVVGLLDIAVAGDLATIDTICVHPDHRRRGIADALVRRGADLLPAAVSTLDAWTREDAGTLAWYRANGFTESEHYLHVYKGWDDDDPDGWTAPSPLRGPYLAYCQAGMEHEEAMRAAFRRVYVCRRFSRPLPSDPRCVAGT